MPIREDSSQPSANSPSGGRKHPIPQNVMDVEFKVVGDLTVRQLMYIFAGLAIGYVFFKMGLPPFWSWVLFGFFGLLGAAVAFIPIQERGLDKWLVSFIRAMTFDTQLVWRKSYEPPAYFLADYAQIIKNEIITLTPAKSRSKLDEYLGQLPDEMNELDQQEFSRLSNISETLYKLDSSNPIKPPTTSYQDTKPLYIPVIGTASPRLKLTDNDLDEDRTSVTEYDSHKPTKEDIVKDEFDSKEEMLESLTGSKIEIINTVQIDRPIKNFPEELEGEIQIKTTTKLPPTIVAQDIKGLKQQETNLVNKVEELLDVTRKAKEKYTNQQQSAQYQKRLEFFKNKYEELSKEKEEINTQIDKNTSRVKLLETSKQKDPLEKQIKSLTARNKELESKLKELESELFNLKTNPPKGNIAITNKEENQEEETKPKKTTQSIVGGEKERFHLPKFNLKMPGGGQSIPKIPEIPENLPEPQKDKRKAIEEDPNGPVTVREESVVEKKGPPKPEDTINVLENTDTSAKQNMREKYEESSLNNVIYGTIKNKEGELIENAIVLVKDRDGNPVRALKTNKLGQYKIQSPLTNGNYTIEAIKGGEKFDIIQFEAQGGPINPINLISN